MASKTISQRISLEGSDDIKKKLEELGVAGEKSFKQIQNAAEKTKIDPARISETKQAFDNLGAAGSKLGSQFTALANSVLNFGAAGTKSFSDVAAAAAGTAQAAQQTGAAIAQSSQQVAASGQSTSSTLISTANVWRIAAVGIVAAIGAVVSALVKGAGETAKTIAGQADKLKLSTAEWVKLREAIAGAGGSFDDFVKGAGKTVDLIQKMKDEIAKASTTIKIMGEGGKLVDVTTTRMNELTKETAATVAAFRGLGVQMKTLQSGNTLAILTETAAIIDKMPDGLKKTAAGIQFFGDNWKDVIKTLLAAKTATVDSAEAMRLKSRELTAEQVDNSEKAAKAWDDLGKAIRATKDLIGAFFAPGSAARAEWLTSLVDGSRELLKEWLKLDLAGRAAFLKNLGSGAVESAFKVLIAVGEQLAGIWTDVLVPAGQKLMGIVTEIAGKFGVTWEQVAAGLITAAIAATAFAIAFKGIAFVLSPITALFSLLAGFGPILIPLIALVVLFWDQLKAGATTALQLIPNSLAGIQQAFQQLFAGNFAGFWALFSASAITAFQTINQAIMQSEGVLGDFARAISGEGVVQRPWVKEFVDSIKQMGVELPGTIAAIALAFVALRRATTLVAPIISRIFGTEVSGSGVILLGLIGSMTGAFSALAAILGIVGGSLFILVQGFTLLGQLSGAIAAATGAPWLLVTAAIIAVAVALALLIIYWPQVEQVAVAAWGAIRQKAAEVRQFIEDWITTPVANAWGWVKQTWDDIGSWFSTKIEEAKQLVTDWVTTPIANAWQWIKDTFAAVLKSLGLGGAPAGAGAAGGQVGGSAGFAGGGLLGGRGSGTSDSNLAWVSRGEFITPARAVSQPGVLAFLEALRRSGGNLRDVLDGMGRFALGGMVTSPMRIPAFAGGAAGAPRNLGRLELGLPGGGTATVYTDDRAVEALRRAAALEQIRSGGRKPSRYS